MANEYTDIPRCEDYSWLFKRECAHCLGHELPEGIDAEK